MRDVGLDGFALARLTSWRSRTLAFKPPNAVLRLAPAMPFGYHASMFFDSEAWPPAPDGFDPKPEPRLSGAQERTVMRMIGLLLVVMFLGPFAGSSVVEALWALVRSAVAAVG